MSMATHSQGSKVEKRYASVVRLQLGASENTRERFRQFCRCS